MDCHDGRRWRAEVTKNTRNRRFAPPRKVGAKRLSLIVSLRLTLGSAAGCRRSPRPRRRRRRRVARLMRSGLSGRRTGLRRTSRRMSCSRARGVVVLASCGGCLTRRWRSSTARRPGPTWSRWRRPTARLPRRPGSLLRRLSVRIARAVCCRGRAARRSVAYGRLTAGRSPTSLSQTDRCPAGPRRCGSVVVAGSHSERRVASELLSALARSSSASTSSLRTRNARPTRTAGSVPWSIQLRIVCAVT